MNKVLIAKEAAEKAIAIESVRTACLQRKAEMYALAIIIVVGFQLLNIKILVESSISWVKGTYGLSLVVLSFSLIFAILAMRLKGYADYPRGNRIWDTLKPESVTEDAAQEALVQLLLKTREQNALLNDAKINILSWCGWLFFAGFLLIVGSQLLDAFVNMLPE